MGMDTRRKETQKAILEAMVTCLQHQQFNEITTTHLAQTAGISRSSFYTHYRDKYQLIEAYQEALFIEIEDIITQYRRERKEVFLEIFVLLSREQLLSALLTHNGSQEIQAFLINKVRLFINNDLADRINLDTLSEVEKDYCSIYFAHAFFGIVQAWINKGKAESPTEMTTLVMKLLP
ncbi:MULTISPECIES: TetR/AcrR family transcriptional regulator [unclassified Streptococcus]|uniref:TetR/AcrR family transcriptional regulator n=1 Tax=unclassified Streptococcus TaxID=2608887 RepID=UPI001072CDB6|nr:MULTISPECIES: TetR/AcrR family transcriptional regulator [unclassified Streptococcus]MBF0787089.1 TetR/AcrR family transcriptional regulator [Streptococcus sp. 19428wC2_LYSM12]MCQ9211354.1 TetR/AcrR family transcriptional regulator [Streptococcus sp. B01]MCQ9214666.1 TetR/AcrR family transcriptional regulator [Streptococcus sp. O1]TFV05976.1 TetR/AcrR family transcriptional regulator [Streptococcus sp. LYSM12]